MTTPVHIIGRYALYGEIAAGGMATVHFGRLLGPVGFSRTVAIKRLHPQYAKDPEFVAMFLDEARLAARIRHPNVVQTLDVVATGGELFLVMDYVQGESLSRLARRRPVPPRIVAAIISGVLHGLHAAHEARNERGEPLDIVHRDISPQNILVSVDGTSRVLDFGVAKASGRTQTTREGHLKGKIAYMAPEQFRGAVTRQTDVYATAIVAWEALTGQRLFSGVDEVETLAKALGGKVSLPSSIIPTLPKSYDEVILKGLAADPAKRYATAREMALAIERCDGIASPSEVGEWVDTLAHEALARRQSKVNDIESRSSASIPPASEVQNLGVEDASLGFAAPSSRSAGQRSSQLPEPTSEDGSTVVRVDGGADALSAAEAGHLAEPSGVLVAPPADKGDTRLPPRRHPTTIPAVVAVLGVLVFFALRPLWQPPSESSSSAHAEAMPTTTLGAVDPPPAPKDPPVVSATPASSVVLIPSAAASIKGSAPRTLPPTHQAPQPSPRKTGCDPPFTIDSAGHKIFKQECF